MAPVQKKDDDFVILNVSANAIKGGRVEAYAIAGPGLKGMLGPHYGTLEEAKAKARELARAAHVSVWYEPDFNKNEGVLVESFR